MRKIENRLSSVCNAHATRRTRNRKAALVLLAAAASSLTFTRPARAAYYWDPGASTSANWTGSTTNWSSSASGSGTESYTSNSGNTVVFSSTAYTTTPYTALITGNTLAGNIFFTNSGTTGTIDASGGSYTLADSTQYDAVTGATGIFGATTSTTLSVILSGSAYVNGNGSGNSGTVIFNTPISSSATGATTLNAQNGIVGFYNSISNGSNGGTLGVSIGTGSNIQATFTGNNTYTGPTSFNGATALLQGSNTIKNSASLALSNTDILQLRSDTNNDDFMPNTITVGAASSVNNITINADRLTSGGAVGNTLKMSGAMNFAYNNATLIFTNGDNYNLALGGMTLTTTTNSGQTFTNNMVNGTTTIASYQSNQTSGGAGTLTFNGTSATGTTSIGNINTATPADMKLAQSGSGTLQITGAANYTGTTTISAGTLSIAPGGSLNNTAVTTSSGATFQAYAGTQLGTSSGGAATLTASSGSNLTFTDNGTPGAFNLYGASTGHALTLDGATMNFDVGGSSTAADELVVNGGSSASMTGTDTIDIYASPGTTSLTPGDYTLIADSGLTKADFALGTNSIMVGDTTYGLSLTDSTSNDEVLTISVVPEPTCVGLVLTGAVGLLLRRRRNKHKVA